MEKPKDVDSYIKMMPKNYQPILRKLRLAIKSASPKLSEKISYGMPYYHYNGRVAYFRLSKNHVGLYIMPPIVKLYRKQLSKYSLTKATIRLPLGKKLPLSLIKKMVKKRVELNYKRVH